MKINVEAVAKYAGLATVMVEWSALLIYYMKMPLQFGGKHPISYFATVPETRWAFTICYVLAAISFWIFVKHYLAKYYLVPLRIFGISLILFACVGLFRTIQRIQSARSLTYCSHYCQACCSSLACS